MKSFLIAATFTIAASCQNQLSTTIQKTNQREYLVSEVVDLQVVRLSGARVQVSWHALPAQSQSDFLVMRKMAQGGAFEKISTMKPKQGNTISDYMITDINASEDSSYYSILQVDAKGVKYFSQFRCVKGVRK